MPRRTILHGTCLVLLALAPTAIAVGADNSQDDFLQTVVQLMSNPDADFRAAAFDQVRTSAPGNAATKQFAAQLTKLDEAGQIGLLSALGDRGDKAARPEVVARLNSSRNEDVRVAAIQALGKLGEKDNVPLLIELLNASSAKEQAAARWSLAQLVGDAVSKALAAEVKGASPNVKAALIEVLATRRASSELPAFVAATTDDNGQVRSAAMSALGQLGTGAQLVAMMPGVLKAAKGGERDNAEKNVALICARIEPEDKRAEALIQAVDSIDESQRDQFLSLIGRVGGKKLINFVGEIATGSDPARRKLGIDALGKWPDASTADKLLEIAGKTKDPAERSQAFQAYVKISATRDKRSDRQRLDRMKQAMKAARSPDEQKLVINRCRTAYDVDSLRFVLPYVDQPAFAQTACETIVELAHHREIRDPNKAEFDKALDKVIATSKNPEVVERAQRYQRGETWERKKS